MAKTISAIPRPMTSLRRVTPLMNAVNTPIGILRETVRSKAKPGLKSWPGRLQVSGVYR